MRLKHRVLCIAAAVFVFAWAAVIYFAAPETVVLYRGAEREADGLLAGITHLDGSIETSGSVIVPTKVGDYTASLSIFGIPYKSITLKVLEEKEVIPGGETIGIRLYSDGLIVVGVGKLSENEKSPGERAGIKVGDVITKVNGEAVGTPEDFSSLISAADGEIELEIKSGEDIKTVSIAPRVSEYDSRKRIGLWVRDSTAGVGTLTYIDPDSLSYGALGHSVSDSDTGVRFEVRQGSIERCGVTEIVKSEKGSPGELRGIFYSGAEPMGAIEKNTASGIFGSVKCRFDGETVPVALKNEVKVGKAVIRTSLDGEEVGEYSVNIRRVSPNAKNPSKGMIIEVTDDELIGKAGGIVQGMSGSPIIQNGMLVGAVTHVLVNDPTMGYAIFAESMIEAANEAE